MISYDLSGSTIIFKQNSSVDCLINIYSVELVLTVLDLTEFIQNTRCTVDLGGVFTRYFIC